MKRLGERHHFWISLTKIILPICGILLLSTLFLWSWKSAKVPQFSPKLLETLPSSDGLIKPLISGVTSNNETIFLKAQYITQNASDYEQLDIGALSLELNTPNNLSLHIQAEKSKMNTREHTLQIDQLARIFTSNGYSMEVVGLDVDLQSGQLASRGQLEIRAPFGTLTAQHLSSTHHAATNSTRLDFTGGIVMRVTPAAQQDEQPQFGTTFNE